MLWVTPRRRPRSGQKGGSGQNRVARCPSLAVSSPGPVPNCLGALGHRSGFSETTNYIRSLWHFRNDFSGWNFLYPKSALNLTGGTSNAGMLQSRMPHLARFQEFHRLSTRRHRVLLRQSGCLKRKIPGPSRAGLLWLIFSPVAFVFSS